MYEKVPTVWKLLKKNQDPVHVLPLFLQDTLTLARYCITQKPFSTCIRIYLCVKKNLKEIFKIKKWGNEGKKQLNLLILHCFSMIMQ